MMIKVFSLCFFVNFQYYCRYAIKTNTLSNRVIIEKLNHTIADAIDSASSIVYGEIYQALLAAGAPTSYAKNIA